MKKEIYSQPISEILEVRLNGSLLTTSGEMNANSWTEGNSNWWVDNED